MKESKSFYAKKKLARVTVCGQASPLVTSTVLWHDRFRCAIPTSKLFTVLTRTYVSFLTLLQGWLRQESHRVSLIFALKSANIVGILTLTQKRLSLSSHTKRSELKHNTSSQNSLTVHHFFHMHLLGINFNKKLTKRWIKWTKNVLTVDLTTKK